MDRPESADTKPVDPVDFDRWEQLEFQRNECSSNDGCG